MLIERDSFGGLIHTLEERERARELCRKDCPALKCEWEGRCTCSYPAPGYDWFERYILMAQEK